MSEDRPETAPDTRAASIITDHPFKPSGKQHDYLCQVCGLARVSHQYTVEEADAGRVQQLPLDILTRSEEEENILEEANRLVGGDRQRSYGHPAEDFTRTARLWSEILRTKVTKEQVAMCMIAVKLSREVNLHGRDNLVDIAGYARTLEMVWDHNLST